MSFEYKEHEADVGIIGIGDTLEKAFEEGAKAMFAIMINIKKVECKKEISIKCQSMEKTTLFVEWLNELLSRKDIDNMFFSKFKINKIEKIDDDNFKLNGIAFGEEINIKKHEPKLEVKGATYSGLKIDIKNNKYYVQCIVDV